MRTLLIFLFSAFHFACFSQTQLDFAKQAAAAYQKAKTALDSTFQKIRTEYKTNPVFIDRLEKVQIIWNSYKEAMLEMKFPAENKRLAYGSIYPVCVSFFLEELTEEWNKKLEPWLTGAEEGDVCTGSVKINPTAAYRQATKNTVRVFYLGGQSNMDGHGYNADLPDSLNADFEDVWIYHGNPAADEKENGGLGIWQQLRPGHGVGFSSDGIENKLSDRFGIELSFAKKLKSFYPDEKIALIKYSRGGSSIDSLAAGQFGSWEPDYTGTNGINQYDHFLAAVKNAMKTNDIDKDGREEVLVPCGIIWMQGESDALYSEDIANRYYFNLKRLMDLIRAALHADDLPLVIGKISDSGNNKGEKIWPYAELVQYAQEKYAKTDAKADIVRSTRYYKYTDPWHYDSNGYVDLGLKFAQAVYRLAME